MSKTTLHILAVAMVVLVALAPYGFAQTITTFDVPGATYTFPNAINPAGHITGNYGGHGFLRKTDGTFTTFDLTGAALTIPVAINPAGQITGAYYDASRVSQARLAAGPQAQGLKPAMKITARNRALKHCSAHNQSSCAACLRRSTSGHRSSSRRAARLRT